MNSKISSTLFLILVLASAFLTSCDNSSQKYTPKKDISSSDWDIYKRMLESPPFNIVFSNNHGQVDDITYVIKGENKDNSISASIQYDPRDKGFYWIEFSKANIPPAPIITDVQILLNFTDKFDQGFSTYFNRNFTGFFEDEDSIVDEGRYINREKGYGFITDGNVALNAKDMKEHPEMKEQILNSGSFASISVVNLNKPSWLFNNTINWKVVEQ
jgi:hypothetical protein